MELNQISEAIVDAAFRVHRELGPGLLESVYEVVLADILRGRGLRVERQTPIPIRFEGKTFEEGFKADLIVEGAVLVEIKSVETLARVHKKQVLTYLKLTGIRLGLLINFGGELLRENIARLVAGEVPDLRSTAAASSRRPARVGSHGGHGGTEGQPAAARTVLPGGSYGAFRGGLSEGLPTCMCLSPAELRNEPSRSKNGRFPGQGQTPMFNLSQKAASTGWAARWNLHLGRSAQATREVHGRIERGSRRGHRDRLGRPTPRNTAATPRHRSWRRRCPRRRGHGRSSRDRCAVC